MKLHSKSNAFLALVLAIAIAATGCSPQWINVALENLPVLTQMALNIATLASPPGSAKQAADAAVIQNISAQASRGLNLLRTLCLDYKANPDAARLLRIQKAIADLDRNLPTLLESAHISDPKLADRVRVAVNLILTTVNGFAALMPLSQAAAGQLSGAPPPATDLRERWNG